MTKSENRIDNHYIYNDSKFERRYRPTSEVCCRASSRELVCSRILFLRASKRRLSPSITSSSCSRSSSPTSFTSALPVLLRRSISGRWSVMFCLCSCRQNHSVQLLICGDLNWRGRLNTFKSNLMFSAGVIATTVVEIYHGKV